MKNRCHVQDFVEKLFTRNEMEGNVLKNSLVEFMHRQVTPYPIFAIRLSIGTLQKPDRIEGGEVVGIIGLTAQLTRRVIPFCGIISPHMYLKQLI